MFDGTAAYQPFHLPQTDLARSYRFAILYRNVGRLVEEEHLSYEEVAKRLAIRRAERIESWTEDSITLRTEIWEDVILPGPILGKEAKSFQMYTIHHPAYAPP